MAEMRFVLTWVKIRGVVEGRRAELQRYSWASYAFGFRPLCFFQMGLNMDEIDLIGPIFYFDGGVVYIGV